MKSLTANQESARTSRGKNVFTVLRFDWPLPWGAMYYSTRDLSGYGLTFAIEPSLRGTPEFAKALSVGARGQVEHKEIQITINNLPDNSRRIGIILDSLSTANGVGVRAYKVFESADGTITDSDLIDLGLYRVADHTILTDAVAFTLEDWIRKPGDKKVGLRITRDNFISAPSRSVGLLFPIVFGSVDSCPCPPLESGDRTILSGDLTDVATIIPVNSLEGFMTGGTIIIDNEEIIYSAVDSVAKTFGTVANPVLRGQNGTEARNHSGNAIVREKITRYRTAACWHKAHSITNIRFSWGGEDTALSGAVVTEENLNGRLVTYIDLSQLPRTAEGRIIREEELQVIADIQGIIDPYESPDEPLSRPENVIRHLIASADFYGVGLDYLDTTSLDAAILAACENKISLNRRIYSYRTARELLESAVWNSGIKLYWEQGKLFAVASRRITAPNPLVTFSRSEMFTKSERRHVRYDDEIINRVVLRYKQSFVTRVVLDESAYDEVVVDQEMLSQACTWGVRETEFLADWIRDAQSAQQLAHHILLDHAWKHVRNVVEGPLDWLKYEIGDCVKIEDADSRMFGIIGRVIETRFPRDYRFQVIVSNVDTRQRVWEYNDENYIDLYGFSQFQFVVGTQVVAVLDSQAVLWLKGGMLERESTFDTVQAANDSPNGEIEYDAGNQSIDFAVPRVSDGSYIRIARLFPTGDFQVGHVQFHSSYPLDVAGLTQYYKWMATSQSLDFSPDQLRAFMRIGRESIAGHTNARLYVRGIREHAL